MVSSSRELSQKYSSTKDDSNYIFYIAEGAKSHFEVSPNKMPDFLADYCKLAEDDETNDDEKSKSPNSRRDYLSISEKLPDRGSCPIVARHLFKFKLDKGDTGEEDLITTRFVNAVVFSYQRAIGETFNVDINCREQTAAVLETDIWKTGNVTCYLLELRFPFCQTSKTVQKNRFRDAAINSLRKNNVLTFLEVQPIGDWDQIIQENGDFLPLYRSVLDQSTPPTTLTRVMGNMKSIHDEKSEVDVSDLFDPKEHTYIQSKAIESKFLDKHSDVNHWIPLFLSVYFRNKVAIVKDIPIDREEKKVEYDEGEDDPFSIARNFLSMILTKTIDEEMYWLDIGRVLFNLSKGANHGLDLFIEISSRCKNNINRDKAACHSVWPTLKGSPLTIKTLAWFARSNNKILYDDWHLKWFTKALDETLEEMTDLDIAEIVYRFFWLDYACSSQEKNKWWYFPPEGHCYVEMDRAFKLRNNITDQLIPYLRSLSGKAGVDSALANQSSDKRKAKELEERESKLKILVKKFKTAGSRNKTVDLAKERFYIENFKKYTNKNPYRTAWPNCVIELCGGKAIFRNGKPEDYITKSGLVPYRLDFHHGHDTVKKLDEYLEQVFVDVEIRRHFKKDIASYLLGKNAEKQFRVWTGIKGDNSKSMMVKLMQLWWGDLCIDIPVSTYTGNKMASSGPSPELAQAESARLGITAEPDEGNDLSAGAVKRATGGDRFFGRFCNENGGSIDLTHKAIYMCNAVPNIPGVDVPTRARFAFLLFLSKWVDNPPDTLKERMDKRLFKKDPMFESQLPELSEAIFWMAVEWYSTYAAEGLIQPDIITRYAEEHWKNNDPYQAFISERLRKIKPKPGAEPDHSNSVSASDIYVQFLSFFKEENPKSNPPTKAQFTTQLMQRLGDQVNRRWYGYVIQDSD